MEIRSTPVKPPMGVSFWDDENKIRIHHLQTLVYPECPLWDRRGWGDGKKWMIGDYKCPKLLVDNSRVFRYGDNLLDDFPGVAMILKCTIEFREQGEKRRFAGRHLWQLAVGGTGLPSIVMGSIETTYSMDLVFTAQRNHSLNVLH